VETRPAATPLGVLLRDRRLWGLIGVRVLADPVFYFQLLWLTGYLQEKLGMPLQQLGAVAWIPSLVVALGIVGLGRWSGAQVARGADPQAARLKLLVLSACLAPLGACTTFAPNIWVAFAIITVRTFVAQTWFFGHGVIVSELSPRSAASLTGIIGACGASGGLLMNVVSGPIIEHVSYSGVVVTLAFLHPLGAVILVKTVRTGPR
jgi:ACS family hexuronate transporter-like MFS transporter